MAELSAASVERSARDYLACRESAARGGAAERTRADRAFARLHRQMVARLGRAIGGGRFHGAADDAEQAVAIGLVKALDTYDPARAKFVTHATWAVRAELKTLGWQLHVDQRPCNRDRGVRTVSGHAPTGGGEAAGELFDQLADAAAQPACERRAADSFAARMLEAIVERRHRREAACHEREWDARAVPAPKRAERHAALVARQRRDAALVRAHLLGDADLAELAAASSLTRAEVGATIAAFFEPSRGGSLLPGAEDVFGRHTRVRELRPTAPAARRPSAIRQIPSVAAALGQFEVGVVPRRIGGRERPPV